MADSKYSDWDYASSEYTKYREQAEELSDEYKNQEDGRNQNYAFGDALGASGAKGAYSYAEKIADPDHAKVSTFVEHFVSYAQNAYDRVQDPEVGTNTTPDDTKAAVAKTMYPLTQYVLNHADEFDLDEDTDSQLQQLNDEFESQSELPCFTNGSLISTPYGEVEVEKLKVGDEVNTLSGPRALKWIGHRHCHLSGNTTNVPSNKFTPVMIRANALDEGVPTRDIRVSPWHHMYVKNVLVRAMDLINGTTIYRDGSINQVTYYHLELEGDFDVIESSGSFSESFSDNGKNRLGFFSSEGVVDIRPDDAQVGGMSSRPGFTVVRPNKNADILDAVKKHCDERSELMADTELAKATA